MNPWFLERMADYETDRIQRDMQQIRLEKEAMRAGRTEEKTTKARLDRSPSLRLILSTLIKGIFSLGSKPNDAPPKSKLAHRARGEQQIMIAEVSDCTSCGD